MWFVGLWFFLCLLSAGQTVAKNILLINVLHEPGSSDMEQAVQHVIEFFKSGRNDLDCSKFVCRLFGDKNALSELKDSLVSDLKSLLGVETFDSFSLAPAVDRSVGYKSARHEHVSELLSSMKQIGEAFDTVDDRVVSLAFSSSSYPEFSVSFLSLFALTGSQQDLVLLDKTRELTSVSDWHDLMVVCFSPFSSRTWFETAISVYRTHADRPVYTLLEPRAALIESTIRTRPKLTVGYFRPHDICVVSTEASAPHHEHGSICSDHTKSLLRINCGTDVNRHSVPACSVLHRPETWKKEMKHLTHDITQKVLHDMNQITREFPKMEKLAPYRFREAPTSDTLLDFCWNTGNDTEKPTESKIYSSSFSDFKPYTKPETREGYNVPKYKIIMMSGSDGHPAPLDGILYPSLNKIYYCHRHGYTFKHAISRQYVGYFGPKFLENTPLGVNSYGQAVMSKVPMIFGMMLDNPDHEWILWTDDDTYINAGWLDLPLEMFLHDVPEDKLVVLANYRSAFTNAFFIRNSPEGRELAMDWLAIAGSGYIQCHGFDQAALETLILTRMRDGRDMRTLAPFNHTCINSHWFDDKESTSRVPEDFLRDLPKSPPMWDWGCDGAHSWSCDFRYENSLTRLGFHSHCIGFHRPVSSISKGCANDYVPDFHITFEDLTRPRLHCGYCSEDELIYAIQFGYDGPLGGGNDWVRRDAVNGWFLNHKTWYPFYETFTKPESCKKSTDFVPPCDEEAVKAVLEGVSHHKRLLVSLTDGYAFDALDKTYCKGPPELYEYQKRTTYMKAYPKLISIAKNFPNDEWKKIYEEHFPRLNKRHILPHAGRYFENKDMCGKCQKEYNPEYPFHDHMVLNCKH